MASTVKDKLGSKATPVKRKTKKARSVNYSRYGYYFIAPFFIIYAIFQLYPLLYTFYFSFQDFYTSNGMQVGPDYVGAKNIIFALTSPRVLDAFKNTMIMWVANFIPQITLALLLAAWFTDKRVKIKGQGGFKVLIFMPNIITAASIAVLFTSLFTYPNATVNNLLMSLGILKEPFEFFRSATATRGIVSFILFWMWYGNTMVVLIAGIMGINPSVFESAQIDGASSGTIFRKITLPLIKPIMLYTLVTSLIGGLQMFDVPLLLQDGNPDYKTETITMYIFKQAFTGSRNYGRSAAVSMVLFAVTAILSGIIFYMLRDKDAAEEKRLARLARKGAAKG